MKHAGRGAESGHLHPNTCWGGPFVQLNTDKNDIKVLTGSKDYYWMKGYHLANPRSTVMGYKRRLPYFSSADVRLSGRPALSLGEAISGLPQRTWPEGCG
ncbi:Uncharacterised protein [Serratia odorifera]|uniref:Uncharacterized protein n=1 Tax=Serratia odorifera TaxID=618 RepID=A0A447L2R6_SEROD|nr:Uncharacterised protein [Serratia odorifera]